jgi:SAM-dependent methyltransferase
LRPQDWAFFASAIAALFAVTAALRGWTTGALAGIAAAFVAGWLSHTLSRRYPGPMSHRFGWLLLVPRGFHSPRNLRKILQPRSGERILEIGPGVGAHALPLAAVLSPAGKLAVVDIQHPMLRHLLRRTAKAGVTLILPAVADGRRLPYAPASFDAAYLVDVLGETEDLQAVLHELRRVLRTGARLVVGEHFLDPDFVSLSSLKARAAAAGFGFERKMGTSLVYFARFCAK